LVGNQTFREVKI